MVDGERIAADDTAEKLGLEDAVREWGQWRKVKSSEIHGKNKTIKLRIILNNYGRSHPESTVFIETCFMFRFRFQK